jgi:hypothetical protein
VHAGQHEPVLDAARPRSDDNHDNRQFHDQANDHAECDDSTIHPPTHDTHTGGDTLTLSARPRLIYVQCLTYYGVSDGAFVSVGTCGSSEYPSEFVVKQGDNAGIYVPGTNLYALFLPKP